MAKAVYERPDERWKDELITSKQWDMIRKILDKASILRSHVTEYVNNKYDAWKFINDYIYVLQEKEKSITSYQRQQIDYIEKYTNEIYRGTGYNAAQTFIDLYYTKANEKDRAQRPAPELQPAKRYCKAHMCMEEAQFYYGASEHFELCLKHYEESLETAVAKEKDLHPWADPGTGKSHLMVEPIKIDAKTCAYCPSTKDVIFTDLPSYKKVCHECFKKISQTPEYKAIAQAAHAAVSSKSVIKQPTQTKGENKMMKNMKALLGDFGKDTSGRFKVAMNGLAVKVKDSYVVFDGESVTDVMDFVLPKSEDMIFKMPATLEQLAKGDVILASNRILFVRALSKKGIIAIDPTTNDEVTHIPVKNMFGFQFYTKVVSLLNFGQPAGGDTTQPFNPMMLMMMSGDDGDNKLEDLLPIMMMSGQLGGAQAGTNPMQQMLPFLLMSGKGEGSNDMMSMMMMSQAFGGQQAGANPFGALFGQPAQAPVAPKEDNTREG